MIRNMSYLFPFIYLFLNSMTRIVADGREVLIERTGTQVWKVSTPIFFGQGEFPEEIHSCLKLIQQMKWDNVGRLEVDAVTGTIHWTQEIHPANYGKEFPVFLKDAQEWAEILSQTLSKRSPEVSSPLL
jgi:hypothetical protein